MLDPSPLAPRGRRGADRLRGELHGSGAVIGKFPSVAVSGTLSGVRLLLVAPTVAEGPAITYQLEAGVTRPAGDVPECPL
jgi:hypothetical protein